MTEQNKLHRGTNPLVLAAAFVIILYGVYQAQSVLVLLLVALFLTIIGTPPVLWLEKKRVPSILAVLAVLASMIVVLLLIGGLVGSSLASFSNNLPFYQKRITEEVLSFREFLAGKGINITENVMRGYINPAAVMGFTAGLLSGLTSTLSSIFLILLTVGFILLEISSFPIKLRAVLGDPQASFPRFKKFIDGINHYMLVKTGVSVTTGILIGIWMTILGVDFPALWGFLAFLLNYIPNLGVIIAAFPAVLLTLIQLGWGNALLAAAGYLAVNFIIGTFIEPKLVGRQVGLSTLVVFLSLVLWGNLLGLIGMVLCIPFTMTLKFALESNDETRWIGLLLGPELPAETDSSILKKKKSV
jgi:predicted PurR-regulated permease PerM